MLIVFQSLAGERNHSGQNESILTSKWEVNLGESRRRDDNILH